MSNISKPALTKALLLLLGIVLLNSCGESPKPTPSKSIYVAPNAPADKVIEVDTKLQKDIQPYIDKARQTYPQAKQRFLNGLPPRQSFFITTRIRDYRGNIEQVFIAVQEIKNNTIAGVIWSDIQAISGYKRGDKYSFPESDLIDWTITRADGSEEGNFVGKFLDTYQPH